MSAPYCGYCGLRFNPPSSREGHEDVCISRPRHLVDVSGLEPDAVRVVELLVSRLRAGRVKYGDLDLGAKDWWAEASEEAIDGFAYLAFETLRRKGKR